MGRGMFIAALAKRVCQQRQNKKLSINGMVVTHLADAVHDAARLKELQALPLERKIQITQTRIIEWYQYYNGQVCVSFSGGKDSTVLLHIARQIYPNIPAVFSNTGLEYPEIQRFVRSFDNVDIVTPSMNFGQVISTYGYPLIGKEVAEAIYYARRIRPSERERMGNSPRSSQRVLGESDNLIETSGARNRRTILQGRRGEKPTGNDWKSWGAEPARNAEKTERPQREMAESLQKSRGSGKWKDYHRRCLNPDESNPEDKDRFWNKPANTEWADWRRGCL